MTIWLSSVLDVNWNGQDLTGYRLLIGPRELGVNLWATPDKQPLAREYVLGRDEVPDRIWVEGYPNSKSTMVIVELQGPDGGVAQDSVLYSVVDSRLTAYRPQTEGPGYGQPFERTAVPRDWDKPVGIRRNGDDDNSDHVPDSSQAVVVWRE